MATIRLDGSDATVAALRGIAARVTNALPMWNAIGAFLVSTTVARFQEGKGPEGQVWTPSLRALAEGGQTLVKTGMLRNSVHHVPNANGVEVGTDAIQAAVMHFGATIRAKTEKGLHWKYGPGNSKHAVKQQVTIPPRPFIGLSGFDRDGILQIAGNYLKGQQSAG